MKAIISILVILFICSAIPANAQNSDTNTSSSSNVIDYSEFKLPIADPEATAVDIVSWSFSLLIIILIIVILWSIVGRIIVFSKWKGKVLKDPNFSIDPELKKKIRSHFYTSIFFIVISLPVFFLTFFVTIYVRVLAFLIAIFFAIFYSGKPIKVTSEVISTNTPTTEDQAEKEKVLKSLKVLKIINLISAVGIPLILLIWIVLSRLFA
jgi:hypothetical protein